MRKALAQNPNLLRTIIGLGLTLIVLLAYAVYGATVSPDYYIFNSDVDELEVSLELQEPYYDEDNNVTIWTWTGNLDIANLSWVNLSVSQLSPNSTVQIMNAGGLWSHPSLGDPDAEKFSCMIDCIYSTSHIVDEEDGTVTIISLTDPEPSLRGKGSVYANSISEAEEKARKMLIRNHSDDVVSIVISENGNRETQPELLLTSVNEEFTSIEQFEIDTATELAWALAAVIGCFSMVLVPSFTVYFASRAKQKKVELKIDAAKADLESESNSKEMDTLDEDKEILEEKNSVEQKPVNITYNIQNIAIQDSVLVDSNISTESE